MDWNGCQADFVEAQQECMEKLEKLEKFIGKDYMNVSCEYCADSDVMKARELRNKLEALIQQYIK